MYTVIILQADTHYWPVSRTARVSQHQKGKTILDFNEPGDDVMAVASAGPYANHFT